MKQAIIVIAVAAIGVAGGIFAGRTMQEKANAKALAAMQAAQKAEADAKKAKHDKRIADLERQLADAGKRAKKALEDLAKAKADSLAAAAKEKKDEFEEALKGNKILVKDGDITGALKKQLPAEQFSQVTNAFAQLRARLANKAKTRQDYLNSIDTSNMTPKQKENHKRYLELFAKREAAADKMRGGKFDPAAIQDMVTIGMEMGEVAKEERAMLMGQLASELGYSGDDATVLTDTIKNIYDCTSAGPLSGLNDMAESAGAMFPGGMGGMGRGRGGPEVKTETQIQVIAP